MLGAIVGDIVGSIYEFANIKTKDFPLFQDKCFFTDDTVMTCATAEAIMNGAKREDFINAYKKYGRMYPRAGYGARFKAWIISDKSEPYYSCGNGSAMRVSPCGWYMNCGFMQRTGFWPVNGSEMVKTSAEVTHNHPEGIKGALAVAEAIFLCRYFFGGYGEKGRNYTPKKIKKIIRKYIEKEYGYNLHRSLRWIRNTNKFDETCQGSVPQAIIAFLESNDFEDAIRNAISIGGDSDTIAAITGSIAEAAYGIPEEIKQKALSYLDENLLNVVDRWDHFMNDV